MRVISKQRNRIIERILSHPFLKEMDFQAKLILLLGSFTLLLIAADLSSEMSKDKDETGFFTACLENLDDAGTNHADLINHDIPIFATIVIPNTDIFVQNTTPEVHPERGPPLS